MLPARWSPGAGESRQNPNVTDRSASLRDAHERATRRVIELTDLLGAIVDAGIPIEALAAEHDPEGATVGFERAQVSALLEGARTQLAELDEALERLRRGSYGTCECCGGAIAAARLDAQPPTRACITCMAEAVASSSRRARRHDGRSGGR